MGFIPSLINHRNFALNALVNILLKAIIFFKLIFLKYLESFKKTGLTRKIIQSESERPGIKLQFISQLYTIILKYD